MTPEGFPETPEEYQQFLEELNEWAEQLKAQMAQQQQQQAQSSGDQEGPSMSMDIMEMIGGGGGEAAIGGAVDSPIGGGASLGGAEGATSTPYGAIAALIAAAMYGQHEATGTNPRVIEGQETGDWFEGGSLQDRSPTTEPWLAALRSDMGLSATAGEKFDAAWKNKDWGKMLERLPATADYWADPIRTWISTGGEIAGKKLTGSSKAGKVVGKVLDPIGALLGLLG